jgi:hypothetical protein
MVQHVKKNRDPRWEEEFTFMLDEPPTNDKLHVEVVSTSSRMGLLHPKVHNLLLNCSYFGWSMTYLNKSSSSTTGST